MYSNKQNINMLTALMVQHGVRHVVVCPGSRNSALAHNFHQHPQLVCHPATDERSAGFLALGMALQDRSHLVAVCVTSGSALLNLHPAVAEASLQRCPVVVISADRPEAWIGQLDGQTTTQPGTFGGHAALSVSLPEPHDADSHWHCNRLINEAFIAAQRTSRPVHINVPVSEPFFAYDTAELPAERTVSYIPATTMVPSAVISTLLAHAERPLVVFGQMPKPEPILDIFISKAEKHCVILNEPISASTCTLTDQMMAAIEHDYTGYLPDLIFYFGGNTISKRLRRFLRAVPPTTQVVMTDDEGELHDITTHATVLLHGNTTALATSILSAICADNSPARQSFIDLWHNLHSRVQTLIDDYQPAYSSLKAVKLFEQAYGSETIHYANSSAIRLAAIYARSYRFCNRGINGIEGSLSTAAGASLLLAEEGKNVFCVIGDLSFFYDENALWQQQLTGNLRILLLNNSEGAIFRNLNGLQQSPAHLPLVAGSHHTSAEGICQQFGVTYRRVTSDADLQEGIEWLGTVESQRPVVLEVVTSAAEDAAACNIKCLNE